MPNGHVKSAKTPIRRWGAVVARALEGGGCALEATCSSRASRLASCELLGS